MPAALNAKERSEILDRLLVVFRDRGYEGSSLADLSEATGLGKSSLYHHFPGGKEQMAEAVLQQGRAFLQSSVADIAKSQETHKVRIRKIVAAFQDIYANGRNPCVLGKLATANIGEAGRRMALEMFGIWTGAIAQIARESGMTGAHSRQFAEDWVARLQGSLILYAATGNCNSFKRTMSALTELGAKKASS